MANPNPDTSGLKAPWKPGQTGNAGGLSKELRAQIDANAAKATRLRAALLDQQLALLDAGAELDLSPEVLSLVKSTEDRGLGAPTQPVNLEADIKTEDSGVAKITAALDAIASRTTGKSEPE